MKVFDKKVCFSFLITIALLLYLTIIGNNISYALSLNVPKIMSFKPQANEANALRLEFDSNNTGSNYSLEIINLNLNKSYNISSSAKYYVFQNLNSGEYSVIMRACTNSQNVYSCSNWTKNVTATISNSGSINVTTPSLTSISVVNNSSVKLDYKTTSDVSGVEVLNVVTNKKYKTTNKTNYTVSGLKENTTYEFKIRSYINKNNQTYYSNYSSSKSIKTNNITVNTPVLSSITALSTTSVKLNYKVASNVTGVEIYNVTTGKTYKSSNKASYIVTGLKENTTYKFKIRAYVTNNSKTKTSSYTAQKSIKTKKKTASYIAASGKIAEATIGDGGKKKGGKPGDQSGKEVKKSNYSYKSGSHSRGWKFVVRLTDPEKANLVAKYATDIANNNNIGYSQSPKGGRSALYNAGKAKGFQFSKITKKVDASCTPHALSSAKATGILYLSPSKGAGGLKKEIKRVNALYKKNGKKVPFKIIYLSSSQYKKYKENLKRGDIICTGSHTAVVL